MKHSHGYKVVDVFASRPLAGNPVAVVFDADGLGTEAMQAIARWTNLSETTFVLPPTTVEADYRLRIFTPRSEPAGKGGNRCATVVRRSLTRGRAGSK